MTFFRKWTTLSGGVATGYEYYSDTLDVESVDRVELDLVVSQVNGAVEADLEVSTDGVQWSKPGGSGHATVNASASVTRLRLASVPARYLRLVMHTFSDTTDRINFFSCGVLRNT